MKSYLLTLSSCLYAINMDIVNCQMICLTSKVPPMEGPDWCYRCRYSWTLDVHIALGRSLVYIQMKDSSMLVTFLDYIISDLLIPGSTGFPIKTVIQNKRKRVRNWLLMAFQPNLYRLYEKSQFCTTNTPTTPCYYNIHVLVGYWVGNTWYWVYSLKSNDLFPIKGKVMSNNYTSIIH
jgi:hypothetical protein